MSTADHTSPSTDPGAGRELLHIVDPPEPQPTSSDTESTCQLGLTDALAYAAEQSRCQDWRQIVPEVLSRLGRAIRAERCYLYACGDTDDGDCVFTLVQQWSDLSRVDGGPGERHSVITVRKGRSDTWLQSLHGGQAVRAPLSGQQPTDWLLELMAGAASTVLAPIMAESRCQGVIGLDQCSRERDWSAAEIRALCAVSAILGAAISQGTTRCELANARRAFGTFIEQSLVAAYVIQDNRFVHVNSKFCEVFGYSAEEVLAWGSILHPVVPEDRNKVQGLIRRRVEGKVDQTRYTVRVQRKDRRRIEIDVHGSICTLDGKPALFGMVDDLSARRRLELEREGMSQLGLRLAAAETTGAIAETIRSVTYQFWHWDAFCLALMKPDAPDRFRTVLSVDTVYGVQQEYPPFEYVVTKDDRKKFPCYRGKPMLVNRAPGDPEPLMGMFGDHTRLSSSVILVPIRVQFATAGILTVQSYQPDYFDENDLNLLQIMGDTIGPALERCRAEEENARLASALEQASESIIITDTTDHILYTNPAFMRMSGFGEEETKGAVLRELVRHDVHSADQLQAMDAALASGRIWSGRLTGQKKDGSLCEEQVTVSPVRDRAGNPLYQVSVRHDVTEEVAMEAELRQWQKMEAIGTLAGGMAHDFNNLLQVILGWGQMILKRLPEDDTTRQEVEAIVRSARRGASLTNQLLAFSRKQVLQPQKLSLNAVVANMERMLQRLIGEDIELQSQLDQRLGVCYADQGQLEQVLMNLAANARDAMSRGGQLVMSTFNASLAPEGFQGPPGSSPGDYVALAVRDTGCGMDAATRLKVFEPFFTTKPKGRGTGLGLSTVYGIVTQSGGFITVESEVGQGSVFTVHLPRMDASSESLASEEQLAQELHGNETILLVENDDEVRGLMFGILASLGYTVLEARHGREALRVSENHVGPIHLLLTDIVMPEMGGRELAVRLSVLRPDIKTVFMSGFIDNADVQDLLADSDILFLQKPFPPDILAERLRRALETDGGA